jgi:hypothetical protein
VARGWRRREEGINAKCPSQYRIVLRWHGHWLAKGEVARLVRSHSHIHPFFLPCGPPSRPIPPRPFLPSGCGSARTSHSLPPSIPLPWWALSAIAGAGGPSRCRVEGTWQQQFSKARALDQRRKSHTNASGTVQSTPELLVPWVAEVQLKLSGSLYRVGGWEEGGHVRVADEM